MNNRDHEIDDEPMLQYGAYSVFLLEEPFEDLEGVLHNYGVYYSEEGVCEATTATLPQAMSIAVSLDRAIREIINHIEEENKNDVDSSNKDKVVPIKGVADLQTPGPIEGEDDPSVA